MTSLMWFRDDLRLHDNAALSWCAARGPLIALFIDEPVYRGTRALGGAAEWWRERSLHALAAQLAASGVPLLRRSGEPTAVLEDLIEELAPTATIEAVAWTRRYHGPLRKVDSEIKAHLRKKGLEVSSHPGHTLVEPWEVTTKAGDPYRVYTPFSKAARDQVRDDTPLPVPDFEGGFAPEEEPWEKAEEPKWAAKLASHWTPGEEEARHKLSALDLGDYPSGRDFPARPATSRLSPHLRFGEVSVREAWASASEQPNGETFQSELLWRDFAWHRLYYHPDLATVNVRRQFDAFDWEWDAPELGAWQRGETGIALVDAGMRELWETGYMHNRVRMVVGSLLTKNLGIHWRRGEEWFWDTLVDADPASNPFNWQWVAGCGDDAAPYFRIFNPETQASKFDPHGEYIAQWAPALSPTPIVDLRESRKAALTAYSDIKK
ncbi:cryptochrome/photolyase family protein [Corynebacterium flavescens]|uniref:cryptochrome/photolyase family protein n=1 Tax=Corynebacterium flavescens TaxID=28028 RepID=UPI003FCFAAC2